MGEEEIAEYPVREGETYYRNWCVGEERWRYGDLSYAVIGALMKVHRDLGPGWDERDYHLCFLDELARKGIEAESKVRGLLRIEIVSDSPNITADGCHAITDVLTELVDRGLHTYSLGTLNRLFAVEARHQHLACSKLLVQPTCGDRSLPAREVNAWHTGDDALVYLAASPDGPTKQNLAVLRSYLSQSGIAQGILVNFGFSTITATLISPPSRR